MHGAAQGIHGKCRHAFNGCMIEDDSVGSWVVGSGSGSSTASSSDGQTLGTAVGGVAPGAQQTTQWVGGRRA